MSSASVRAGRQFVKLLTQAGGVARAAGSFSRVVLTEACDASCETAPRFGLGVWGGAVGGVGTVGVRFTW